MVVARRATTTTTTTSEGDVVPRTSGGRTDHPFVRGPTSRTTQGVEDPAGEYGTRTPLRGTSYAKSEAFRSVRPSRGVRVVVVRSTTTTYARSRPKLRGEAPRFGQARQGFGTCGPFARSLRKQAEGRGPRSPAPPLKVPPTEAGGVRRWGWGLRPQLLTELHESGRRPPRRGQLCWLSCRGVLGGGAP